VEISGEVAILSVIGGSGRVLGVKDEVQVFFCFLVLWNGGVQKGTGRF